jgi:hypothetical protein
MVVELSDAKLPIDRFYGHPQALDVSLEKGIRTIWVSADKSLALK